MRNSRPASRVSTTTWPIAVATLCVILAVVAAAVIFVAAYLQPALDKLDESTRRVECFVKNQADFQALVGQSFNSPPAPNPERDRLEKAIQKESEELVTQCR